MNSARDKMTMLPSQVEADKEQMGDISNSDLINRAVGIIHSRRKGNYTIGDVACALLTDKGNVHLGVCIDTSSGMGFCAEHNAIGSMVTNGEFRISKIVAVWINGDDSYILAPCGRCREFILAMDERNLETEVILGESKTILLKELLPYHGWCNKISALKGLEN